MPLFSFFVLYNFVFKFLDLFFYFHISWLKTILGELFFIHINYFHFLILIIKLISYFFGYKNK